MTPRLLARLKEQGLKEMRVSAEELIGRYAALDVINEKTGEIYVEAGQEITQAVLDLFDENGIDVLPTLAIDHINVGPYIRNTLAADKNSNREEALLDIYRVMRPGEPPTLEQAETLFQRPAVRPRPLRPLAGRPRQDEHAPRTSRACPTPSARCAARTSSPSSRSCTASRTAAARSTTSTISATAASARSAS